MIIFAILGKITGAEVPHGARRLSSVFNYTLPLAIQLKKTAEKNSESIAKWYGDHQASCPIGSLGYGQTTLLRFSRSWSISDNALLVHTPANIGFLAWPKLSQISQTGLWCGRWKIKSPNPHVFVCLRLKCDGTRAETRFRLSAKRTSRFNSAGGVSLVEYLQPRCAHQR